VSSTTSITIVPPGGVVGILGGGQLGRMLALSAARLGLDVHVFAPEADCPASRVSAKCWTAPYDDEVALLEFANSCDVITFEFENIPAKSLEAIADAGKQVFPRPSALAVSQDRLIEKQFLQSINVPPVSFEAIDDASQIAKALDRLGGKGILKLRREGYDGKGQARIETGCDADAVFAQLGGRECLLEAFIAFDKEISVLVARGQDGATAIYEPPCNDHGGGILRQSTVPSGMSSAILAKAEQLGLKLAQALDYVGILALELFVMPDGTLYANEFAPRVHNSGHWTDDACYVSQFEQHIRAVCGWPLGPTMRHSDVVMDNLLGDRDIASWNQRAAAGEAVRIYAKRGGGEGRKLGHANRMSPKG